MGLIMPVRDSLIILDSGPHMLPNTQKDNTDYNMARWLPPTQGATPGKLYL